jgi:hypothetical protein
MEDDEADVPESTGERWLELMLAAFFAIDLVRVLLRMINALFVNQHHSHLQIPFFKLFPHQQSLAHFLLFHLSLFSFSSTRVSIRMFPPAATLLRVRPSFVVLHAGRHHRGHPHALSCGDFTGWARGVLQHFLPSRAAHVEGDADPSGVQGHQEQPLSRRPKSGHAHHHHCQHHVHVRVSGSNVRKRKRNAGSNTNHTPPSNQ